MWAGFNNTGCEKIQAASTRRVLNLSTPAFSSSYSLYGVISVHYFVIPLLKKSETKMPKDISSGFVLRSKKRLPSPHEGRLKAY